MAFWILALETSGPRGGVALWNAESETGAEEILQEPFRHAEELPGRIQTLYERFGVKASNLDLVAVVRGPGYFTALRVGVAYAKALWLAHGVPLVAPTGLEVLAFEAGEGPEPVVSVINAQRKQVYYAVYQNGQLVEGPGVARPEALLKRYPGARFVGPGLALFPGAPAEPAPYPSPLAVARWGWQLYRQQGPADAVLLEPLYIRDPDALQRLRQRSSDH